MTSQKQADQIFSNFCEVGLSSNQAKQCAFIAVNYIINSNPHSNPLNTEVYPTMKYWQLVKKHIEIIL